MRKSWRNKSIGYSSGDYLIGYWIFTTHLLHPVMWYKIIFSFLWINFTGQAVRNAMKDTASKAFKLNDLKSYLVQIKDDMKKVGKKMYIALYENFTGAFK